MVVIREDVVSIGFEVENNPFEELTSGINESRAKLGILDASKDSLKSVGKEAGVAASQIDSSDE